MTNLEFLEKLQELMDRAEEDMGYLECIVDDVEELIEEYDNGAEI